MARTRSRSRGRSLSSSSIDSSSAGRGDTATAGRRKSPGRNRQEKKDDELIETLQHEDEIKMDDEPPPQEEEEEDNGEEDEKEDPIEQKDLDDDDGDVGDDDVDDEEDLIDLSEIDNRRKDAKSPSKVDDADGDTDNSKYKGISGISDDVIRRIKQITYAAKKKGSGVDASVNTLTELIPGYTAPMKLDSSSLDKYRPAGGIRALQKQAMRYDASTKNFVLGTKTSNMHVAAMSCGKNNKHGGLPTSYTSAYGSFKKGVKRAPDLSAGSGWFGMKPTPMTDELKADIAVIRNRSYLDPKRFYKNADKSRSNQIVQLGTVIEGPSEYFSSRLTKKQRRSNITEEFMNDGATSKDGVYVQRKFKEMAREKTQQSQMRNKTYNNIRKKQQKNVKKLY